MDTKANKNDDMEETIEINEIKFNKTFMANFFNLRNSKLFTGKGNNDK